MTVSFVVYGLTVRTELATHIDMWHIVMWVATGQFSLQFLCQSMFCNW